VSAKSRGKRACTSPDIDEFKDEPWVLRPTLRDERQQQLLRQPRRALRDARVDARSDL
jgi:hypothetical protein